MTGRAAAVQGGLAAAGLLVVYFTWQREPERAPGAVTVLDAAKADVTRVHYADASNSVDFQRGSGDQPIWIHLVPSANPEPKPSARPGAKPEPPKPKAPPDPPRDLVGGEPAAKLLDDFAPLVSPRAFGILDASKLKELGLAQPTRKLEVTLRGDTRRFEIGQPENATGGEAFLRDVRDGRVYLMPRGMLSDLQSPSHLVDRRLHAFESADFDRMVLSSGDKRKEYLQLDREVRVKSAFAPLKSPDKHDQMAKNWHDALWRAFPSEILGRGEEPATGKPTEVLRVEYYDGKTSVGFLELARVEAAGGVSEEAPSTDVYARTEHTAGWLKLSNGAQLVADGQKLISAP
jgi:Domain of unknown function (DUF4340)